MSTQMRRKSLTTVEELVVEHTLGTIARTSTLSRIQRLTAERQRLYAQWHRQRSRPDLQPPQWLERGVPSA